jgi:FkbM family methyltransferase
MDIFSRYKAVIENTDRPVVLELGAAEGEDTIRYLGALEALGRPFRYIAFEPDERNIWHLERVKEKHPFDLVPKAVGDQFGTVSWRSSNHPYSGSVKKPIEHLTLYPHIRFGELDSVGMVRLDDIARGKVDWIWCDVQGAEDLVIDGGQETLKHTRYFYTEYIECQAYQGQIGRDDIHKRLPGTWEIAEDYRSWDKGGDCLFRNLTVIG